MEFLSFTERLLLTFETHNCPLTVRVKIFCHVAKKNKFVSHFKMYNVLLTLGSHPFRYHDLGEVLNMRKCIKSNTYVEKKTRFYFKISNKYSEKDTCYLIRFSHNLWSLLKKLMLTYANLFTVLVILSLVEGNGLFH